jgi:hypothetical protein
MLRCTNRRDVLRANTVIFKEHGLSLSRVGKSTTKVRLPHVPGALLII